MSNVLVTGGSRGVGKGICQSFLEQGHNVVFTCRSQENLSDCMNSLSSFAKQNIFRGVICDSGIFEEVRSAVSSSVDIMGSIDILVNNAGLRKYGSIQDINVESWIEAVNTNINGYFYFCKLCLPHLKKSIDPWIFNIGSTAAYTSFAGGISYNTTKAAVHALSSSIELDVRKEGIRVCTISPGNIFNKEHECPKEDVWMMKPVEVGYCIVNLLKFDKSITPTIIELKPTDSPDHPEKGIRTLRYI